MQLVNSYSFLYIENLDLSNVMIKKGKKNENHCLK